MRNVTPEQVAMAEQHRRGELPDRIEGALGELAGAAKEGLIVLKDLIESGKVRPVIDRTYPLAEAPKAIRYLEEGHAKGKVVITV